MLDFSHIQSRIEKPTTKATNERASLIELFVTRINNSRRASGYKPYTPQFVASKMSHIRTGDLHAHYKMLDGSKNFSALWHWLNTPKKTNMIIFCTNCQKDIDARLTDGKEIYPHREDLHSLPFWKCDTCSNYVGCHHKTKNPTNPLGVIPSPEIKNARKHIHAILDPLWQSDSITRKKLYNKISRELGYTYHTGEIRTIEEARNIYRIVALIHLELKNKVGKTKV